jgi:hypothetical protein
MEAVKPLSHSRVENLRPAHLKLCTSQSCDLCFCLGMGGEPPPEIKPSGNDELRRLILQQAHEMGLENVRAALTEYQVDTQRSFEMFRAGTTTGAETIKAAILINGGAAVAVLAFIGHLVAIHAPSAAVMNFAWPLALFVIGVLASALASGVTYLVHWCYVTALNYEFAGKKARRDDKDDVAKPNEQSEKRWNRIAWRVNLGGGLFGRFVTVSFRRRLLPRLSCAQIRRRDLDRGSSHQF